MKTRKPAGESGIDRLLRAPVLPPFKALPRKGGARPAPPSAAAPQPSPYFDK